MTTNVIPIKRNGSRHDFRDGEFIFKLELVSRIGGCRAQYTIQKECNDPDCEAANGKEAHLTLHESVISRRDIRVEWWDKLLGFTLESKTLAAIEEMKREIAIAIHSYRVVERVKSEIEK